MSGLDLLGAEAHREIAVRPLSLPGGAVSIGAGILGAMAWRAHPVLGFLGASAIAGNVYDASTKRRPWKVAAERVGRHAVATAGSLALPSHPVLGYIAAAFAADLLLDETGSGVIEEWVKRADSAPEREVIDVTPVKTDDTMVKR